MKQKRKVSVLIALMMLLTVFAVPSMAFGASYSYKIVPAGKDKMPDYVPIGGKVDLNIVSNPAGANVAQSDWTWKVEKDDSYFKGNVSAIATIDQNGVLTAKGEGSIDVVATNPAGYYDDDDDYYGSGTVRVSVNIGYITDYSGVRIYPNKTAKVMSGYASDDMETYAVPTQVIIEKATAENESDLSETEKAWYNQYQGTYTVTAIREDAISSDTVKNFIVPDAVKNIGTHAMGYRKVSHSSEDPAKATYLKTSGVTIFGQSNNPAAAKYAKANGFTYKNMNTGKTVTITVTPNKPSKVAGTKAKAGKKQMTVTWKRDKKANGYQITYAQSKNFKKAKKNVTITKNKTTKKVIKKLKSGKKYYVKVRAYKKSGSKKVYGAYSKVKTVKVK